MDIKSKRILAWIIDWFICCAIANLLAMVLMHNINPISILLCVLVVLACFATFICRDVILTEGSVGKQIFKLQILDSETGGKPSVKQRIVRSIFSLIYPIDGLALLISGQSSIDWRPCLHDVHGLQIKALPAKNIPYTEIAPVFWDRKTGAA